MNKPGKAEMAAGRFFFGPFRTLAIWAGCAISCAVAARLIGVGWIYFATGKWAEWKIGVGWNPVQTAEEWAALGLIGGGVSIIGLLAGRMFYHRECLAYRRERKAAREKAAVKEDRLLISAEEVRDVVMKLLQLFVLRKEDLDPMGETRLSWDYLWLLYQQNAGDGNTLASGDDLRRVLQALTNEPQSEGLLPRAFAEATRRLYFDGGREPDYYIWRSFGLE